DGILDGDFLVVQSQNSANKGDTIVAMVEEEATVKNFFKHSSDKAKSLSSEERAYVKAGKNIELRPANSSMKSMFYSAEDVNIQGILVGLVRRY
ncbi:MAG: S24 family peptidase, partial [Bdellovibrionota bacterium]|nr:S24 family peptidase [Bdellovibrionota bacterium]